MARLFLFNNKSEYVPIVKMDPSYSYITKLIYNRFDNFYKFLRRDVVIICEQKYWSLDDYLKLSKFFKEYSIDTASTYFIIDCFLEPRTVDYSTSIEFLCKEEKVKGKNISFVTAASNKDRPNRHRVNIEENPIGSILFTGHGGFGTGNGRTSPNNLQTNIVNKTKLFSSLNRRVNISRYCICCALYNAFNEDEYVMSLGTVLDNHIKEQEITFYQKLGYLSGGDKLFSKKIPLVFDKRQIDPSKNEQWIFNNEELSKCMFGVINETNGANLWMDVGTKITHRFHYSSEKSLIPFFNFQIPIFFDASPGHFKWFKDNFELDLFEDIVPHEEFENIYDITHRTRAVVDFLKAQNSTDYNTLFLTHKDRFVENLNRLHKLYLKQENILQGIGDSIIEKVKYVDNIYTV